MSYIDQTNRQNVVAAPYVPPPPEARPPVAPVADAYPRGDGTFSTQSAGTAPDPALDYQLALMSNDSYAADNPQTEQELQAAGWHRLTPSADGSSLVDAQGNEIPIDPALLSTGNGFDAAIYQNAQGQYVVAYRGTDDWGLTNSGDANDNGLQGLGFEVDQTSQYSDAIALAQHAEQVFGDGNVVVTGHSLGGGLASAASIATGATGVTFNAAGLSNNTLEQTLGQNPNAARQTLADNGQIRRYAVNGDPLTAAQEDLATLPVVGSPPNAIGHALRIDAPAGLGFDLAALHGGGGDGSSYVEAFRQHAPYDPSQRPTPSEWAGAQVDRGFDFTGDQAGGLITGTAQGIDRALDGAGDVLRANPALAPGAWLTGVALDGTGALIRTTGEGLGYVTEHGLDLLGDGAEATIGFTGNVARDVIEHTGEFQLNQIGSLARNGTDVFNAARDNFSTASSEIDRVIATDFADGDYVEGSFNIAGDVLDASIDTVGDAADGVIRFTGDTVQNGTDFSGGVLRSLGEHTGLQTPFNAVAGVVEGGGQFVSDAADVGAEFVDSAADLVGDGVEVATDFAGDVGEGIADGARWVGENANPLNWFN
jgi:hypothetical protein